MLQDGSLASCSWYYTIIIWDVNTGLVIKELSSSTGQLMSLAVLHDDSLASGSDFNTIWSLKYKIYSKIMKARL